MVLWVWLATGADGRWHPGIGDPTFIGWFTVASYMGAAYLCFRARAASLLGAEKLAEVVPGEAAHQRMLARFWLGVLVLMFALGVNKQLDLQTFMTQALRDLARAQGWYAQRRPLQFAFVFGMAVIGCGAAVALAYWLKPIVRRVYGPICGVVLITVFVLVRAASFHHLDVFLYATGPVRLNWVLELSAIAILGVSAYRAAAPVRGATG